MHASCVLIGEAGILIRGPSGSGKSTLARDLLDDGRRSGRLAHLVGDDRITIEAHQGRVLARAVPAIAGRLEIRGVGLVRLAYEASAVVRLVVDCGAEPSSRLPEAHEAQVELCGIWLPRLTPPRGSDACSAVLWRLSDLSDTFPVS